MSVTRGTGPGARRRAEGGNLCLPFSERPIVLSRGMLRVILIYGVVLAAGALGLQWLQYRYVVRTYPAEIYFA